MQRKKRILIMVIVAIAVPLSIVVVLAAGNHPPVIDSLQAQPDWVFPGGTAQILCTVSAPEGAVLSYEWRASGGEIYGDGSTVTWTAPDSQGVYNISVTVTDRRGREDTRAMTIMARDNLPPEIDSLTADADWVTPEGSLNLTCDAEDPDGHTLSYQWSAEAGHFEGTGAEVTWLAPEQTGIYEITVVVSDDYGGSATETLSISVMPDQPPVVEALLVTKDRHEHCYMIEYSWGYKVGQRQKYDIECIVAGTGVEVFYEWSAAAGEISEISDDGSMITWIAPSTSGYFTVTVVVSDVAGNTASPKTVALDVVGCSPCTFRDC